MAKNVKTTVKPKVKVTVKPEAKTRAKTKKSVKKRVAKAPVEFVFWCHDGNVFMDLDELARGLKNMTDETYVYHSNGLKHDFSSWVRDVIGDEQLADELEMALNRLEAVTCIEARIC